MLKISCLFFVCFFSLLSHCLHSAPAQVVIIRHAEKPPSGPELDDRGWQRAAALVPFFLQQEEVLKFGTPAAIYAQAPSNADSSRRPIETVQGLAQALNLTLNTDYDHKNSHHMVKDILANTSYAEKMVLICWEHTSIPDIAKRLGATNAPHKWHSSVFDRVWILTFDNKGNVTFEDIPQKLMYGDSQS